MWNTCHFASRLVNSFVGRSNRSFEMPQLVRVTHDPERLHQSFRDIEDHDIFQVPISRDDITGLPVGLVRPS